MGFATNPYAKLEAIHKCEISMLGILEIQQNKPAEYASKIRQQKTIDIHPA